MESHRPAHLKISGVILSLGVFVLFIFLVGRWIDQQINNMSPAPELKVQSGIIPQPAALPPKPFENIIRKIQMDPSREYYESVFFSGDQEMARFKNLGEKVYDVSGKIPDGVVKFENITDNTSGTESYIDGKRDGLYQERYSDGQMKREAEYRRGDLVSSKEYFVDGILRMEEDLSDALMIIGESQVKEIGVGKVYSRKGELIYEWHFTNKEQGGYNRSYNRDGELVAENIFDRNGVLIKNYLKAR